MAKYVQCECCGQYIVDDIEHNAYYDVRPCPSDLGEGLCEDCIDFANDMVFNAGIELVLQNLNELNREKFLALPFARQQWIIMKLVDRNVLGFEID